MGLVLSVEIKGERQEDLELGLEETLRKVREGYTSGFDRNETGRYSFAILTPLESRS